jgi:hypothetical protein
VFKYNKNRNASGEATAASNKSPLKRHYSKLLFAALALIPVALLAQNPAPTPRYSDQTELSKVEEWVLSQGTGDSIAPELAAIFGLGSDRLPVRLKSFRTTGDISYTFAVSNSRRREKRKQMTKSSQPTQQYFEITPIWVQASGKGLQQLSTIKSSVRKFLVKSSRVSLRKTVRRRPVLSRRSVEAEL